MSKQQKKTPASLSSLQRVLKSVQRQTGELWDNLRADGPAVGFDYKIAGEIIQIQGMLQSLEAAYSRHTSQYLQFGHAHKSPGWLENAQHHGAGRPWQLECSCVGCTNKRELSSTQGYDEEIEDVRRRVQVICQQSAETELRNRRRERQQK